MSYGNVPPGSPPGAPPGGYGPPPGGAPPGAPPGGGGAGGWGAPPAPPGGGGGGWGAPPGGHGPPPGFQPGQQPYGQPAQQPGYPPPGALAGPGGGALLPPEDIEPGKTWAILSYASSFLGLPLWIIPLIQKDNAFALYHAKQALGIFIGATVIGVPASIVFTIIATVTCGIGAILFLAFLAFLYPIIVGLMNALNGKYEPVPWFGYIPDKYFPNVVADKRPAGPPR